MKINWDLNRGDSNQETTSFSLVRTHDLRDQYRCSTLATSGSWSRCEIVIHSGAWVDLFAPSTAYICSISFVCLLVTYGWPVLFVGAFPWVYSVLHNDYYILYPPTRSAQSKRPPITEIIRHFPQLVWRWSIVTSIEIYILRNKANV